MSGDRHDHERPSPHPSVEPSGVDSELIVVACVILFFLGVGIALLGLKGCV